MRQTNRILGESGGWCCSESVTEKPVNSTPKRRSRARESSRGGVPEEWPEPEGLLPAAPPGPQHAGLRQQADVRGNEGAAS